MLRRLPISGCFTSRVLIRHAANMSTCQRPTEPLVAIMGTTGTGKSDLAVDLAVRFNGEIINADAMQMYKGLPIITNQISSEERRGIPHHLLATVDVDQPTWTVGVFAREAIKLIREIRSRGKLPIVVGGTHYYISSLLFPNTLVESLDEDAELTHMSQSDIDEQYPILSGPTDLMLRRLREVDPAMGLRWHPDDRRKIRRSLEIFLTTGRRASDIYEEQQKAKAATEPTERPWNALMFWVYSNPEILKKRLDQRVDNMERNGLITEVRDLHKYLLAKASTGENVDRTRGIWQSIGFKQFEQFLVAEKDGASASELSKLKDASMELTKISTRQYARYQLKWFRAKTVPEIQQKDALEFLYLLDSSEAWNFSRNVLSPAASVTQAYLDGVKRPEPASLSATAKDVLLTFTPDKSVAKPKYESRLCHICNKTLQTDDQWIKHTNSRHHRKGLKHKSRTALVVIQGSEISQTKEENAISNGSP